MEHLGFFQKVNNYHLIFLPQMGESARLGHSGQKTGQVPVTRGYEGLHICGPRYAGVAGCTSVARCHIYVGVGLLSRAAMRSVAPACSP
jgi:hypothetical protein